MQRTFLFYDLETTGLDKSYDQVQQFAAIRTDMDLNEIERFEYFVKINPDVLPSPQALIIHRISLRQCNSLGLNEYEAMQRIHALVNTPNTISIGYNTLGFDDEFLRFSFHRNLLPPYSHQFANGCARADLYPMAAMLHQQEADTIIWPTLDDNRPTLKLEHLSQANQLAQGQAHNAIVDVEATIALAKKFQASGASWDYLLGYFDKFTEQKRLAKLTPFAEASPCCSAIMIDGNFGGKNHYQCPVLGLGQHHHYRNQTLWLKLDQDDLSTLTPENLATLPWIIRKKTGEPPFFLPDKTRFLAKLTPQQQQLREHNLNFLQKNPEQLQSLQDHYLDWQYPELPPLPAQAALYQNAFLNSQDQKQCQAFHQTPPEQKAKLISQFKRDDLKQLASQIMARHYPEYCPQEVLSSFKTYQEQLWLEPAPLNHVGKPKQTLETILDTMHQCQQQPLDAQQKELLDELEKALPSINTITTTE